MTVFKSQIPMNPLKKNLPAPQGRKTSCKNKDQSFKINLRFSLSSRQCPCLLASHLCWLWGTLLADSRGG